MTQPYYIADRRERDMVEWHEASSIEVREFNSEGERGLFWSEWLKAGGTLPQFEERPA